MDSIGLYVWSQQWGREKTAGGYILNYSSFTWQWSQMRVVSPTTGNAYVAIGFNWDMGKTQEVWLLNVSKDFPLQNVLKKGKSYVLSSYFFPGTT